MSHASGALAPDTEKRAGGTSARVIFHALRRRPLTLLGVVALAAGVGAGVWFFLPLPKLTAVTVFHISPQAPTLVAPLPGSGGDLNSYRQAQMALVKRRITLSNVVNQPTVQNLHIIQAQSDPVAWLDRYLVVDSRTGTEFMRLSIEGENGDELRVLLDAIAKAYLAEVDERDNGLRRTRLAKLDEKHREYATTLARYHKRMDEIAFVLGSKDITTLMALEAFIQGELQALRRDLGTIRGLIKLTEEQLRGEGIPIPQFDSPTPELILPWGLGKARPAGAGEVPAGLIAERLRADMTLRELEAVVTRAQRALDDEKQITSNPTVLAKYETALKDATLARDNHRNELRTRIEFDLRRQLGPGIQGKHAELLTKYTEQKQQEKVKLEMVTECQKSIDKSKDYRIELDNIKLQVVNLEKLSNLLGSEIEHVKLEIGAPSRVTLLEEPYVVTGLEGNRRLKYTLLAVIGVLVVGLTGVVVWERRTRRMTHTDDVTMLGVRLIGAVPPTGGDRDKTGESRPVLVEAIDATRTMLLNSPSGAALRVLVVTSAVSAEGKTSLSGHLAISLARAGFRTLLIDGDLRAPSAHELFQLAPVPGLCELLRNQASLNDAVRPTGVPGLSVMPAGEWTLSTRQALVGDRWRLLTEQLKAHFDFVVIDSSPLLLVSDTLLLAREADGVVVSVMMGVSQVSHVTDAIGRLEAVGAKFAGVVANGVRTTAQEYAHGYKRSSGDSPSPVPSGTHETSGR